MTQYVNVDPVKFEIVHIVRLLASNCCSILCYSDALENDTSFVSNYLRTGVGKGNDQKKSMKFRTDFDYGNIRWLTGVELVGKTHRTDSFYACTTTARTV